MKNGVTLAWWQMLLVALGLLAPMVLPDSRAIAQQAITAYDFDTKQVKAITVNGRNLLTGNGIYLIGSASGADGVLDPYNSPQSRDGLRLRNGRGQDGPPFKLQFWQNGLGSLSFRAEVGPVDRTFNTLSMPFDFAPAVMDRFAFDGSRYRVECTGARKSGSDAPYASIVPQCHIVRNEQTGVEVARVGVAIVESPASWAEVNGSVAKVRVNIRQASHYQSLRFHHHTFTNNLELSFGTMRKGEKAWVEGEMIVAPNSVLPATWVFEAERDFAHQIGRRDAEGWSVRVGDTPGRYMNYGPYTTVIAGGSRTATFRLLVDNSTADNLRLLTLDVYDATAGKVLASRDVTRRQFGKAFAYQDFSLPFVAVAGHRLEFRTFWHNYAYVRQDKVSVR